MKKSQRDGAPNTGGCGCETSGEEKASNATQITKGKGLSKPPLQQPSGQNGLAGIPGAIEYRGEKFSVALKTSGDSADHDADRKRWTGARPKHN
jgi:hypothetical protein